MSAVNDEELEKTVLTVFGPVHPTKPGEHILLKNPNQNGWTCAICESKWEFDNSLFLEERLQEIRDARDAPEGKPVAWPRDVWENWVKCPAKMK